MDNETRMYQKMYHILLQAEGEALSCLKERNYGSAERLLQEALLEAEDVYVRWEEEQEEVPGRSGGAASGEDVGK